MLLAFQFSWAGVKKRTWINMEIKLPINMTFGEFDDYLLQNPEIAFLFLNGKAALKRFGEKDIRLVIKDEQNKIQVWSLL
jgi:hypothetical protein